MAVRMACGSAAVQARIVAHGQVWHRRAKLAEDRERCAELSFRQAGDVEIQVRQRAARFDIWFFRIRTATVSKRAFALTTACSAKNGNSMVAQPAC